MRLRLLFVHILRASSCPTPLSPFPIPGRAGWGGGGRVVCMPCPSPPRGASCPSSLGVGYLAGRCCVGVCCVSPLFIAGVSWSKTCPVGSCVVGVKYPCHQRGRFPRSLPSLGDGPGRCICAASRSSMSLMERFLFSGRPSPPLPSLGVRVGRRICVKGCSSMS